MSRSALKRLAVFALLLAMAAAAGWFIMLRMPGKSFRGTPPPMSQAELQLQVELERDVRVLAGQIGPRHILQPAALKQTVEYIEGQLIAGGYSNVSHQEFKVGLFPVVNLEVEKLGTTKPEEIIIIGAHYDSVALDDSTHDCPAANDNGSGVAATLALARRFADTPTDRTIRFVFFVNEEPPFFQTDSMGSWVYAKRCRSRNENVIAMLALETIGCYTDEPGSQQYPPPLSAVFPSEGDFVAFVGNVGSRSLVREAIGTFRRNTPFPSEGAALPGWMSGVGWSDHWAFWQEGYCAIMVTDTAPFRYPYYHSADDTPDKLDYGRFARVVTGLEHVVKALVASQH